MSAIAIFPLGQTPQYIPDNVVPGDYAGRNDVVIDPDISGVAGLPFKYWKMVGGAVQAMTAQEQAAQDAADAATALTNERTGAIAAFLTTDVGGALLRAIGAVMVDEINLPRQWIMSFKAAEAAATSFANHQARIAALPDTPDRTLAQFKTAITNKINSGAVDS